VDGSCSASASACSTRVWVGGHSIPASVMGRCRRRWNPGPGGSSILRSVHLLGHLTNPSSSLQAIFNALPDEPLTPTAGSHRPVVVALAAGRLGNGVVQRAVVKVLTAADEPMRLRNIHEAVGKMLGRSVSYASVEWCLRMGIKGEVPRFERVQPGSYRLAS
jgi:hypothetical protein